MMGSQSSKHPGRIVLNSFAGLRQFVLTEADGSSLVEFAFMLPLLVLLLVGAVDFGRAWYVNQEVAAAAEAGALYGVQNPNDVSGMQAATLLAAPDLSTLQSAIVYGSECSDGTGVTANAASSASCPSTSVEFVKVTASATYRPILAFTGIPSTITMTGKAFMRSDL